MKDISAAVAQSLFSLHCSHFTPTKSIRQALTGGAQGGFWVLFHEPHLLPSIAQSQIAQTLIDIKRTNESCVKR